MYFNFSYSADIDIETLNTAMMSICSSTDHFHCQTMCHREKNRRNVGHLMFLMSVSGVRRMIDLLDPDHPIEPTPSNLLYAVYSMLLQLISSQCIQH